MAYGVKYRLEFSDFLGFGKKLEILKKDYTGEVLPIIGGAEPVTIKWNAPNDFYKPIIGSQCTIDLMVTDDVKYDDFYKFDEREYKVKISYSKSISQSFADRVLEDQGIYESLSCVDDFFGFFYNSSTYYNERVSVDNGRVESLGCVSSSIVDEKYNIWEDYWVGYLVVDRFTEKITSTPYSIRFNAFDGLGTLKDYDSPLSTYNQSNTYLGLTDLERISKILQNLDLDLDLVFINDLRFLVPNGQGSTDQFPNSVTFEKENSELYKGLDLYTAKQQLELLLSLYNMRIYQSFGKWHITEVTNNFDSTVKDNILDLNQVDTPPLNIRELITKRLKSLKGEFINARKYDYLGASNTAVKYQTVKNVPAELKSIKNSLNREYLQPLQSVKTELSTTQLDKSFHNTNPGFEYGLNGWVVTSNRAVVSTDLIEKQGRKSIYLDASTSGDLECIKTIDQGEIIFNRAFADIKYQFSFYVDSTVSNLGMNIRFQVYSEGFSGSPSVYYNSLTNKWQSSSVINEIENFNNNKFVDVSKTLKNPADDGFGNETDQRYLQIKIFNTTAGQTGTGYLKTYFDNLGFSQEGSVFGSIYDTNEESAINISATRTSTNLYSSVKNFETILTPGIGFFPNWYRSRDAYLEQGVNKYRTITDVKNQAIINDFREFCTRSTGVFVSSNPKPVSISDKIYFNWAGILEDPEATIIDGMTFKLKSGEYSITSHLPNNDNDLNVNVRISS